MWNNLTEFKKWWLDLRHLRPPFKEPIYVTETMYEMVLFKEGRYQVRLCICKADSENTIRLIDGAEQIIIYVSGNLTFNDDLSEYQKPNADGTYHLLLGVEIKPPYDKVKAKDEAGTFIIFEKLGE